MQDPPLLRDFPGGQNPHGSFRQCSVDMSAVPRTGAGFLKGCQNERPLSFSGDGLKDDGLDEDGNACGDGTPLPPCEVDEPILADPIDEDPLEPPEEPLCEAPPALTPPELVDPPAECCESRATEITRTAAKRKPESRMKHLPKPTEAVGCNS